MGAEAGSSLLQYVGLLGVGYVLGRVQVLQVLASLYDELYALPSARKAALLLSFLFIIALYIVAMLLPLRRIADQEARRHHEPSTTSFRRELRRRGSYSMSYVNDIKAHVFARTDRL